MRLFEKFLRNKKRMLEKTENHLEKTSGDAIDLSLRDFLKKSGQISGGLAISSALPSVLFSKEAQARKKLILPSAVDNAPDQALAGIYKLHYDVYERVTHDEAKMIISEIFRLSRFNPPPPFRRVYRETVKNGYLYHLLIHRFNEKYSSFYIDYVESIKKNNFPLYEYILGINDLYERYYNSSSQHFSNGMFLSAISRVNKNNWGRLGYDDIKYDSSESPIKNAYRLSQIFTSSDSRKQLAIGKLIYNTFKRTKYKEDGYKHPESDSYAMESVFWNMGAFLQANSLLDWDKVDRFCDDIYLKLYKKFDYHTAGNSLYWHKS